MRCEKIILLNLKLLCQAADLSNLLQDEEAVFYALLNPGYYENVLGASRTPAS